MPEPGVPAKPTIIEVGLKENIDLVIPRVMEQFYMHKKPVQFTFQNSTIEISGLLAMNVYRDQRKREEIFSKLTPEILDFTNLSSNNGKKMKVEFKNNGEYETIKDN